MSEVREIKNYAISDISKKGINSVIRSASEDGYSLISRNSEPVALVMPLSAMGLRRFYESFFADMSSKENVPSEIKEIVRLYKLMFDKFPIQVS